MAYPCPVCEHAMKGDVTVCGACEAALVRTLDDVAWLATELDTTLSRQTPRTGAGSSEVNEDREALVLAPTALPFSGRASEAGGHLKGVLVGWARVLMERDTGPGPADTLTSVAGWLSERAGALARHEAGAEAHGEITEAVEGARRAVDRPAERAYAGPCPECGADVYARPGAPQGTCRECGLGVDVQARQDAMREKLGDMLAPASDAGAALRKLGIDVPDSTIRWFAHKGRILARGKDRKGRPLYRIGDIVDEAAKNPRKASAG